MRYDDASHNGSTEHSGPVARPDVENLPSGTYGPASGNAITGAGTASGAAGADQGGASIVEVHGAGGQTVQANGAFQASGQYGLLSMTVQGDFQYVRNPGTPEGVKDVFSYTVADADGATATTTITVAVGPAGAAAAIQNAVALPAGVELSDIHVNGRDLVINMPDGTQMVIPGGAVFVPELTIGDVQVPPSNLAALLIDSEPKPAEGPNQLSSGGNFADPVPPLDPGAPLGDLIPPTVLPYQPPEFQDILDAVAHKPTVIIETPDNPAGAVDAQEEVFEKGLPSRDGNLPNEPAGSGESADGNGLNNSDNSETNVGTIVFEAEDGLKSITVDGVAITNVGQQIQGQFGIMTITGINIPGGQITYSYTLTDNTSGDNTHDVFTVVVTDKNNDTATATLTVNIIDDVPTARNDTDSLDQNNTATGNVMTGVGTTSGAAGADTVGADNAHLTGVQGAGGTDTTFDGAGHLVVQGQFGTLTIDANGNYTYQLTGDLPEQNSSEVFHYTLTDGDGDTSTATLTIPIPGEPNRPPVVEGSSVNVSEEGLPGGIPDSNGTPDTTDSATATGSISISDPDGDPLTVKLGTPSGSFTSGSQAVNWSVSPDGHTLVGYTGSDSTTNHVIEITIDNAGHYAVNLIQPFDDPNVNIEDSISFNVPVTVSDGQLSTPTTITVTVEDDSPTISFVSGREGGLVVDESGPGAAATIDLGGHTAGNDEDVSGSGPIARTTGTFNEVPNAQGGADGVASLLYGLNVTDSSSGVTTTEGEAITLVQLNATTILGIVAGNGEHGGDVAFAIQIDGSTGQVTVEQYLSLNNPDATNPNDAIQLGSDTIALTATVTDGDGDHQTGSVDVSKELTFLDDGPTLNDVHATEASVTVDESGPVPASAVVSLGGHTAGNDPDVSGSGPIATGNSNGAALVSASIDYGADGPGTGPTYSLVVENAASGLTTTDGHAITLELTADGTIVGIVQGGTFDGQVAFAMGIDGSTGEVTIDQYLSLHNPDATDPNDPVHLGEGTIGIAVSATDGDGDPVSTGSPVDISGHITFLDDGPTVSASLGTGGHAAVDESPPVATAVIPLVDGYTAGDDPDLAGGLAIGSGSTSGSVINANAAFGADGPAASDSLVYSLVIGNGGDSGLTTTEGQAIDLVELSNGVVAGVVHGTTTVAFAIEINASTGVVTVEQYLSLSHPDFPNNYNEIINLAAGAVSAVVTATDGDGDTQTSNAVDIRTLIDFYDDGPDAVNDSSNAVEGTTLVVNTSLLANDTFGADGPQGGTAHVTSLTHGATTVSVPNGSGDLVIAGTYGTLTVHSDGTYTYLATQGSIPPGGATETFSYKITDGDGDTDTAQLQISVGNTNLPPNATGSTINVSEEGLSGGIPDTNGSPDTTNLANRSGSITISDPDGDPLTVTMAAPAGSYTSGGAAVNWYVSPDGHQLIGYTGADHTLNHVIEVTIDNTGAYTVNLVRPFDDPNVNAEDSINFTIPVNVSDGQATTPTTIVVTVEDDSPTISASTTQPTLTVDETDLTTNASTSFAGVFTSAYGADGAGTLVYQLGITGGNGVASGLVDTATNQSIVLVLNGNVVEGHVGNAAGALAFTVSVNSSGTVTLDQIRAVVHADPNDPNDSKTLSADNLVTLTATITDKDGDHQSATANIGQNLVFQDDGPHAATNGTAAGTVVLDETRPVSTDTTGGGAPSGLASATINFSSNFVTGGSVNYGADGAGTVAYALHLTGSNVNSGLYALDLSDKSTGDGDGYGQGSQIVLNQSGNTITGTVGATTYFTITIDPATGIATFTQVNNIWNPTAGSSAAALDDTATLTTALASALQVQQIVTDKDGDSSTASLNIGQGVFQIQDDGPTLGTIQALAANDDPSQTPAVGSLHLNIGTDGFSAVTISPTLTGLTSGGHALVGSQTGNVYTAFADLDHSGTVTAGDTAVFTVTVDPNGGTSGTYTFDLLQPLDGTTVDTPIGGSSAFGAGPTGFQVLEDASANHLSVLTGYNTTASFNEATWLATGNLTSAMIADAGINGSTSGWGVDNNVFSGTTELMFFDFGSQALSDPDGAGGISPSGGPLPDISFATFDFIQYTTADDITYVVHFTDGTFASGHIPSANLDPNGPNWTYTAPSGKFIADIELLTSGAGPGKVDLVSVGVQSTSHDITIPINMTFTDGDGDTVTGSTSVHITDGGTNTTPNAAINPNGATMFSLSTTSLVSSNDNHKGHGGKTGDAGNNTALMGAVAAAGLAGLDSAAAAHPASHGLDRGIDLSALHSSVVSQSVAGSGGHGGHGGGSTLQSTLVTSHASDAPSHGNHGQAAADNSAKPVHGDAKHDMPGALDQGTHAPAHSDAGASHVIAPAILMPSAQQLAAAGHGHASVEGKGAEHNEVVGKVLADALHGGGGHGPNIDALVSNLPGHGDKGGHAELEALASHGPHAVPMGHTAFAGLFGGQHSMPMEAHHDAAPAHG